MPPPSTPIDGVVEKKTFTLQSYVTVRGETIKNVKIGWESYGSLNTDKSNGIDHARSYNRAAIAGPKIWRTRAAELSTPCSRFSATSGAFVSPR